MIRNICNKLKYLRTVSPYDHGPGHVCVRETQLRMLPASLPVIKSNSTTLCLSNMDILPINCLVCGWQRHILPFPPYCTCDHMIVNFIVLLTWALIYI